MNLTGRQKRERIFNRYSANLKEVLDFHKLQIATKIKGEYVVFSHPNYICPLCLSLYTPDALISPDPTLTLEHNPPKNIGGNANILTCKTCNNSNGSLLDTAIGNFFEFDDFVKGKADSKIPVVFRIESYKFKGDLQINAKESALFINQCSNEYGFKKITPGFQNQSIKNIHFSIDLPKYDDFPKSCLKIAHLAAFEMLGYSYLFNKSGNFIVRILKGELKHPCKNFGLLGTDFPDASIGVNVLNQPEDLKGVIIVIKIKHMNAIKNVGVLLPSFIKNEVENLSNLYKYYKTVCTVESTKLKFSSKPISPTVYYSAFCK